MPYSAIFTALLSLTTAASSLSTNAPPAPSFVIIGGTGRIGTAVASHIIQRVPTSTITLTGRDKTRGRDAINEVLEECPQSQITFRELPDYHDISSLQTIIEGTTGIIHVAGPYLDETPIILQAAIESESCKVYVDVSDPLDFINESLSFHPQAVRSGTSALIAAGAFPGLSNVLAVEAASSLRSTRVKNISFNYFTAGLGGSGDVNLYITNLGFGEDMAQYKNGELKFINDLSGRLLGDVDFSMNSSSDDKDEVTTQILGKKKVFAWPFPEAATVAKELNISGSSSVAMGTAPDIWNVMLGLLVTLVPRAWWRSRQFSKFMADFSNPLVKFTDYLLKLNSPDDVGETHAIRIDVEGDDGGKVWLVQAHESFRRCVGQSCAEFALDLLDNPSPGVTLPETRYRDCTERTRILSKLLRTKGTIGYSGIRHDE